MSKPSYEQKIDLIERYKKRPMAVNDPDIFTAIQVDVVKAYSNGVRKAPDKGSQQHLESGIYNDCMGVYREFLKSRDSHLALDGKKARQYKDAMINLIAFIRKFQQSNQKPSDDAAVLVGLKFIFAHWDRLNDFHKNRLALPDIYSKIEEILPMIKNGYDKKSSGKAALDNLEQSIKSKRQ